MKPGEIFQTENGQGIILCVVKPKGRIVSECLVYFEQEDTQSWFTEDGKESAR